MRCSLTALLLLVPLHAGAVGSIRLGRGLGISQQEPQWTPRRTAPAVYLRADWGVTLNGANVSAWADQSGNGRNATQATGANQPPYVADDGDGRPAIDFGNAATVRWLALADTDLLRAVEGGAAFAVHRTPDTARLQYPVWVSQTSVNSGLPRAGVRLSAGAYQAMTMTAEGAWTAKIGGAVPATWTRWGANWGFAANTLEIRAAGASAYSGVHGGTVAALPDTASDNASVGNTASAALGSDFLREVLVWRRTLTAREITLLEAYQRVKWGAD